MGPRRQPLTRRPARSESSADRSSTASVASTSLIRTWGLSLCTVELEREGEVTRSEVAAFLREFANELDVGAVDPIEAERRDEHTDEAPLDSDRITFIVGGDSATVTVPNTVEFDVEVESRSPMLSSSVSQEIDLELSWQVENPDEASRDQIEIE